MADKYSVGYTVKDNVPCILVDGDSVFAIFPSVPNGMHHAKSVCAALNFVENFKPHFPNVHYEAEEDRFDQIFTVAVQVAGHYHE